MNKKISLLSINVDWSSLAKESIEKCPKIRKDREKDILFDRFGLEGKNKTLQAIGDKHGITRERVRQIVNNGIKKIQENCVSDNTKKTIKIIEDFVTKNGGYVTTEFLAKKFTDGQRKQINSLKFVANLSKKISYVPTTIENHEGWRVNKFKIIKAKEIIEKSTKILKEKNTPLTAKRLAEIISEKEDLINASLSASNKLMKTDKNKWGFTSWPQINPKSIKDKSRYVMKKHGKPIHYHDLSMKISEISNKQVTKQSVHNELIKNKDFILVGRGIYALAEWGYEPGIVEEVIVEILNEAGEPLHKNVIIKRVLERRIVKPSTIVLNLQKPRFKKVDKKVYTLN